MRKIFSVVRHLSLQELSGALEKLRNGENSETGSRNDGNIPILLLFGLRFFDPSS